MARTRDFYPSNWINADMLPDGKDVSMTIAYFTPEVLNDGTEKPVVYFKETEKGLILNKTNFQSIEGLHGDTDNWPDKLLSLYKTEVSFMGETKMGVRVRITVPKRANVTAIQEEAEEIPL